MHRRRGHSSCTKGDWKFLGGWGEDNSGRSNIWHEIIQTWEHKDLGLWSAGLSGVGRQWLERETGARTWLKGGWWATTRSSKDDSFGTSREMNSCPKKVKMRIWVEEIQSPGEAMRLPEEKGTERATESTERSAGAWCTGAADRSALLLGPVCVCHLLQGGWNHQCAIWQWDCYVADVSLGTSTRLGPGRQPICSLSVGQHGPRKPLLPGPPASVVRFRHLFGNILWTPFGD